MSPSIQAILKSLRAIPLPEHREFVLERYGKDELLELLDTVFRESIELQHRTVFLYLLDSSVPIPDATNEHADAVIASLRTIPLPEHRDFVLDRYQDEEICQLLERLIRQQPCGALRGLLLHFLNETDPTPAKPRLNLTEASTLDKNTTKLSRVKSPVEEGTEKNKIGAAISRASGYPTSQPSETLRQETAEQRQRGQITSTLTSTQREAASITDNMKVEHEITMRYLEYDTDSHERMTDMCGCPAVSAEPLKEATRSPMCVPETANTISAASTGKSRAALDPLTWAVFVPDCQGKGGQFESFDRLPLDTQQQFKGHIQLVYLRTGDEEHRNIYALTMDMDQRETYANKGYCLNVMAYKGSGQAFEHKQSLRNVNRACDRCIRERRLCVRIMRDDQCYKLGFFPLPIHLRVNISWEHYNSWIRK